jgi:hypothetical protein
MAANVLYHENGLKALPKDFEFDIKKRSEMEEKVKDTIKKKLPESSLELYPQYIRVVPK